MGLQLVWFKRDLRLSDHAALHGALRRGPVLGVFVFSPEWLKAPTTDPSHVAFVIESLRALADRFRERGGALWILHGSPPDVLTRLHSELRFEGLWAHQETTDLLGYDIDRRVRRWARSIGLPFTEPPQNGVIRGRGTRRRWAAQWEERARRPLKVAPETLPAPAGAAKDPRTRVPTLQDLGVPPDTKPERVAGGEPNAQDTLESFLFARGAHYRTDLSSPITSWDGCSRLSPYIACGNISIRQVWQASRNRLAALGRPTRKSQRDPLDSAWRASLESFESRLRWHCHFIQKMEDEPELEIRNANRAYDGLRTDDPSRWTTAERDGFEAWRTGRTGYPLVDAVMRALHFGGWINFRMRAMLASFACHHLWLHWKEPALALAPHFLDYEPGIHYTQFQMQAGTFGMNTTRIYSPAKQVRDQDPDGMFVRRYVPELEAVPAEHIAEPHKMPKDLQLRLGCRIGKDYPAPIVPPGKAYARARSRLEAVKQGARAETRQVWQRHGSRRRPPRRR